jgi:PAS domain S-box-containing protein
MLVYLIEDNYIDAQIVTEMIAKMKDVRLKVFMSLAEFFEGFKENQPEVILVDLGLPDSSGIETALKVLQVSHFVPVVVLTGDDDDDMAIQAIEAGAQDYLVKGVYTFDALKRVLRYSVERKHQEEKHFALIKTHISLFNNMKQGVIFFDSQTRVTAVNPAAERILGQLSRGIIIGTEINELFLTMKSDEGEIFLAENSPISMAIQTKKELRSQKIGIFCAQKSDFIWLKFDLSFQEAFNENNDANAMLIFEDVTKKRLAKAKLERLAAVVEQAAESIVITDKEGIIQYVNPSFEKITGFSAAEAIGNKPNILKSNRHSLDFYQNLWNTVKRGQVWSGRLTNKRKDGLLFSEDATIFPVLNSNDEIVNLVAVKKDVTREVELETQLRQSQKMEAIGQLAGGIAHDFNNIIQALQGYSDLLAEELTPESSAGQLIAEFREGTHRAADLTRQLLAFSRRQKIEPKKIAANDHLTNLLKMIGRTIGADIALKFEPGSDAGNIFADPGQIDQVIMNLCVNARDAMPEGGSLIIKTGQVYLDNEFCQINPESTPGDHLMISIADTGSGMTEDVKMHVFEPFFTTKMAGKGTGLGLATVFGIVKQHKGIIEIETALGRGTTFKLYFPTTNGKKDEKNGNKTPAPVVGGTETILVAEDDVILCRLSAKILEKAGYTVVMAYDGQSAIDFIDSGNHNFDCAILDVVMPNASGTEVYKYINELKEPFPVIFCSGYASERRLEALNIDLSKYLLLKPFIMTDLLKRLRTILDE